jgi:hypothetical protein
MLLTATTVVPSLPVVPALSGLGIAVAVLVACGSLGASRNTPGRAPASTADPRTWTMPPIESLGPPQRSAMRTFGLIVLRCCLFAAMAFLAARAVQIALASG